MSRSGAGLVTVAVALLAGCNSPAPTFDADRAYLAKQERDLSTADDPFTFTSRQVEDVDRIVVSLFGTPDAPRVPVLDDIDAGDLLDEEKLALAAGPVASDEQGVDFGLYREHCAHCHGITGDGRGPTAAYLNPYPRDYRAGTFKWKSTTRGERPTHEDLARILTDGVPGTSMPSFKLLSEGQIEALIQYVRYLAMRGEVERRLILMLADLDEGAPLVEWPDAATTPRESEASDDAGAPEGTGAISDNRSSKEATSETAPRPGSPSPSVIEKGRATDLAATDFETLVEASEGWEDVYDVLDEVVSRWERAEGRATDVPAPSAWMQEPEGKRAAVARGRQLFHGTIASCSKCHGTLAVGDGQINDFDDWTKEYHIPEGDRSPAETYANYAERYDLLPARNIIPRNLRSGVYRGGRRPIDLYWRLVNGIDGTPMPAVPLRPDDAPPGTVGLTSEEVWCLVEYVLSLPRETINNPYDQATSVVRTTP